MSNKRLDGYTYLDDTQVNCFNCEYKRSDHINRKLYCFKGIIGDFPLCDSDDIMECFKVSSKFNK
jgi:hypothetical protein